MNAALLLLLLIPALFVATVALPQRRLRRQRALLETRLAAGSDVLTVGGLYGRVVGVRDADLDLEVADGVVIRIDRRAVAAVIDDAAPSAALHPGDET